MNKIAWTVCGLLLVLAFSADAAGGLRNASTGTIGRPGDRAKVTAALGRDGVLFIHSAERWDELQKRIPDLFPDRPLLKIDFAREAAIFIYAANRLPLDTLSLVKTDLSADPPLLDFLLAYDSQAHKDSPPLNTKFILFAFPTALSAQVSLSAQPAKVARQPEKLQFSALLGGKDGGDVVDGLQVSITPKAATLKPGEDILIDVSLHLAELGGATPELFASAPQSVFVWDATFSEGYRNHAFFVTTPDGKTSLLRPKEVHQWPENGTHPVEITAKSPYHLEGDKSLKDLGLNTTAPGKYTITALYEETGSEGKTKMWCGSLASNTIKVEVKNPE